jgi:two-component system cell cycle sensor histidine kinase/response regulator CckA
MSTSDETPPGPVQTLTLDTYRALFESAPDAMIVVDASGAIVIVNSQTERLLGYSREELVGRPLEMIIAARFQDVPRLMDSGTGIDARCKNGSTRLVDISFSLCTTEQGTLNWGTIRDLAARTEVEKLRQSQQHLVVSQHVAGVGSWEIDLGPAGDRWNSPPHWSDECYRVFGYRAGEVAPTHDMFWARVHPEDRLKLEAAIQAALRSHTSCAHDHRILLDDGSERIIHEQVQLVFDDTTGAPIKVIGTAQDVTDRVHREAQLRQSQKMQAIGQLAGGVAHDFNNLLTVINGHSEMLLMDRSDPDDPIGRELAAIRDAGERATHLTRQLLLFSRRAVIEPRILDCNAVVRHTIEMLRRLIGEDVTVTTVLAPSLYRIRADASQMEQVVMNLALNARDAMPNGGRLSIETRNVDFDAEYCRQHPDHKIGHFVQLMVSDTGCGMTPHVRAHLFEPFFTTKGPGKGTGLGLATVYGIVHEGGGFITVATEVDAGATFNVFLPALADDVPASGPARTDRGRLAGRETVLLVEDEAGVRHIAKVTLEMYGYTVIEAASGADAIRLVEARTFPVHLLLTDVVMPGMSGRQLADAIRLLYPDCRIVFMSGYNEDAVVHHGLDHMTNAFLQKPFTPLMLARKLRDVLDHVV